MCAYLFKDTTPEKYRVDSNIPAVRYIVKRMEPLFIHAKQKIGVMKKHVIAFGFALLMGVFALSMLSCGEQSGETAEEAMEKVEAQAEETVEQVTETVEAAADTVQAAAEAAAGSIEEAAKEMQEQ